MKKSLLSCVMLMSVAMVSCAKANPETKSAQDSKSSNEAQKTDTSNLAKLNSLSKDQQEAVKMLVREVLVSNPEILLEAQEAYEAKMMRQQNELAAKSFDSMVKDEAQLSFGPANAKVTIVEFFDYKCGFCHAANPWVMDKLAKNKDVRFIFKELPILSPNSHIAAQAALASHAQGKYLDFHKALMNAKGDLNIDQILEIAKGVGLDVEKLKKDMVKPEIEKSIENVRLQAEAAGINGTPGFLINGKLISGFAKQELEAALGAAKE